MTNAPKLPLRERGWPRFHRNHRLVWQWALRPWVSLAWNVFIVLFALVAGVAQKLDDGIDEKSWHWIHEPKTQLTIGIGFAVVVGLDSTRRLIYRVGSWHTARKHQEIRKQLSSAIAAVSDETGVKAGDLGCGLFLYHQSWRRGPQLIRIERVRLLDNMGESGVVFRRSVGTVGSCWETRNPAYHNWTVINNRYYEDLPDEQDWVGTRAETKHGFDYESWKVMVGRYAEILAVPVHRGGEMIGVLAIDRKWYEDDKTTSFNLNKRTVKASLWGIARLLEPVLGGSS